MEYADNFNEQRSQTNAKTVQSDFYELLYELHDFSVVPEGEEHYTYPEGFDPSIDDCYDNITLHASVTLEPRTSFDTQLASNKTTLLAEIDRKEDLLTRWQTAGTDRPWSTEQNPEAYFRDEVWNNDDTTAAEANLLAMEAQKTSYDASPDRLNEAYKGAIVRAMAFGQDLMADYGVKNLVRGYSEAQIKQLTLDLKDIQALLVGGALNTARTEIFNFTPTAEVVQADIDEFVAKIDAYLA